MKCMRSHELWVVNKFWLKLDNAFKNYWACGRGEDTGDRWTGWQMNMWTVCSSSEPRLKIAVGVPLASLQHIVTSLEPSRVLLELLSTLLSESLGGTSRAKPLVRLKPAELGACRCWAAGQHGMQRENTALLDIQQQLIEILLSDPRGKVGALSAYSCPPVLDILVFLPWWSWRWNVLTRCFALVLLANMRHADCVSSEQTDRSSSVLPVLRYGPS